MIESDFDGIASELDENDETEKTQEKKQEEPVRMSLIEEKRECERLSRLMAFSEEL